MAHASTKRSWALFAVVCAVAALVALAVAWWRGHHTGMQRARVDSTCSARIVSRRSLSYRAGAEPALDRPAHVRAASGVAWVGSLLGVVQDDANFIALVEPESGQAIGIPLPPGDNGARLFDEGRGTKNLKLDLEGCFSVRDQGRLHFIALGSGSKPLRERILAVTFDRSEREVDSLRLLDASAFYAQLHQDPLFSGSELNLEGAVLRDQTLLLFQRGNGKSRGETLAINAVGELDWPLFRGYLASQAAPSRVPPLTRVTRYDLGQVQGVPFTFTDATLDQRGGILFLASAEDSSDSVTDGLVHGTRVGQIASDGSARITTLQDEDGKPSHVKAEGLVLDRKDPTRAWVVVDMDDPALASELLEVRLRFPP